MLRHLKKSKHTEKLLVEHYRIVEQLKASLRYDYIEQRAEILVKRKELKEAFDNIL